MTSRRLGSLVLLPGLALWLLAFVAAVVLRALGVATAPWAVVLLPLWGPPVLFLAFKVVKWTLILLLTVVLR